MLRGNNIILKLMREDDLEPVSVLRNDVMQRGEHFPLTFMTLADFKRKFDDNGLWAEHEGCLLVANDVDDRLGEIFFFRPCHFRLFYEIGYLIYRKEDRGKGFMTEALRILSAFLFETKPIARLELTIAPGNAASCRIAEKCGYQLEGTARAMIFLHGRWQDCQRYALLRADCPPFAEALDM